MLTRTALMRLQTGTHEKEQTSKTFHGTRVLIVEDMQVNQMLMNRILHMLGCQSDPAMTGQEAIERLTANDYDIVFMDCHMPEMDGYEATRRIRDMERTQGKHSIIIALTADAMTGDREKCLNAGMDDFLNKPFKPEQISDVIRKWVGYAA